VGSGKKRKFKVSFNSSLCLHGYFSKEVQMSNKYMKKCSTLLLVKDMQIKTIMSLFLTPNIMAIIKSKQTNKNTGKDVGKVKSLFTIGENVN
jgi:predicted ThiF/HesA family dinucleotide-utilizing enzyme